MRITLQFVFNGRNTPSAVTGVESAVTDMIVPSPGDFVEHRDLEGNIILGQVTRRSYRYLLGKGDEIDGEVVVLVWLDEVRFPGSLEEQQ